MCHTIMRGAVMLTQEEISEIQEEIRNSLPECCKDCTYIDGLGVCQSGGCGCEFTKRDKFGG